MKHERKTSQKLQNENKQLQTIIQQQRAEMIELKKTSRQHQQPHQKQVVHSNQPMDQSQATDQSMTQAHKEVAALQCTLGQCYAAGTIVQDYTEALRLFRLSAAQKNAAAQYHLGLCYEKGQGVSQDHKEAVRLYRLAAAEENMPTTKMRTIFQISCRCRKRNELRLTLSEPSDDGFCM